MAKHSTNSIIVKATGYSMYPFICPGMILVLQKTSFAATKITDVISYPAVELYDLQKQKIAFKTHRVFRKNHNTIYTKGDNNSCVDLAGIRKSTNVYRLHKILYQSKEFIRSGVKSRVLDAIMYTYSCIKLLQIPDRFLKGRKWITRRLTGFNA